MQQLKFKNSELTNLASFLAKLPFKNRYSRARSKLRTQVVDAITQLTNDETELFKGYCDVDDNGELVPAKQGGYTVLEGKNGELDKAHKELLDEVIILGGGKYQEQIALLQEALEKCDQEWTGTDADMYDRVLDEFEDNDTKDAK